MANLFSALSKASRQKSYTAPVDNRGGWWPWVQEPYSGAWQQNDEWHLDSVLAYPPVYACVTLIASDISKLRPMIVQKDSDGIWSEREAHPYAKLLYRPNNYQNHIQFFEWWLISKLVRGNAYVLKQRDNSGNIVRFHLLEPERVQVLTTPVGDVYYQFSTDHLSGIEATSVTAPASEVIHDRINPLFHPLVGVSPLFSAGESAASGQKIINDSKRFFTNGARPGGILSAPGAIADETAARLKAHWETNYSGENSGKVAVLGDGLAFEPMRMTSVDAQLIEQLKWSAESVCSAFHVPAYKVGVGQTPTYANAEILNQIYYSDCLQKLIEDLEVCLDQGLDLPDELGVELDLDGLFRMDSKTKLETLGIGVTNKLYTINDGRKRLNLKPVEGGDTIYMQQQDYSLQAIHERDQNSPLLGQEPVPPAEPVTEPAEPTDEEIGDQARALAAFVLKEMQE